MNKPLNKANFPIALELQLRHIQNQILKRDLTRQIEAAQPKHMTADCTVSRDTIDRIEKEI